MLPTRSPACGGCEKSVMQPRGISYAGDNAALLQLFPPGHLTVLDVGCGRGEFARRLKEAGHVVDALTWRRDEADAAAAHCRRVLLCDLNQGLPALQPATYDLAVCSHVIEHIAYPEALLRDLHRVLNAHGHLLVAIPNLLFWIDRLKLLRGEWKYEASGTFDATHLRWYTRESMTTLLDEHGFAVERFLADGWIALPGLRFLIGKRLRRKVNEFFCRWRPGLFGQQLLFRAAKR
jgi:SAM-dependent methyltransferase